MISLDAVYRAEYGRCVGALMRAFGDLDLAEEAVQEAFATAVTAWPVAGMPPNPGGWIVTTARNKALDRLRREALRDGKQAEAVALQEESFSEPVGPVVDDRLRLLFVACHPVLPAAARSALALRLLGGLTTPEVARAFLVPEATMAARITRAKKKIASSGVAYAVPSTDDVPIRLPAVLQVIYLIFNEAHTASAGDELVRVDLADEAIRLARLVLELVPSEPEARGLLGLLLLVASRRAARVSADGELVTLPNQDRTRWDAAQIAEGQALVRECLRIGRPGPFQLQAAINAVHSDAPTAAATDWRQILALYDQLLAVAPSPVVALNRAVALAEVEGPAVALLAVDAIDGLDGYHLLPATRADLLRRMGRADEARAAYTEAIGLAQNDVERAFLQSRRESV